MGALLGEEWHKYLIFALEPILLLYGSPPKGRQCDVDVPSIRSCFARRFDPNRMGFGWQTAYLDVFVKSVFTAIGVSAPNDFAIDQDPCPTIVAVTTELNAQNCRRFAPDNLSPTGRACEGEQRYILIV